MDPEDQLRGLADPDRWSDQNAWRSLQVPPARPASRATQAAGRKHPWMPPALVVAAVVAVVAGGVAIAVNVGRPHNAPQPSGSPSSDVVPWKALAASKSAVVAADSPTCDATALTASSTPPDVAMGAYRLHVTVTNRGSDCSLPNDQVSLRSNRSDGSEVTIATATGDAPHLVRQVAQGATLDFSVAFDPTCTAGADTQQRTAPVLLGIAGADVPVRNTALPPALRDCSRVELVGASEDDESTYPGLAATLTLPETTTGNTLDYTVTLTNTGNKPITFETCPNYKQMANAFGAGKTTKTYQLNCAGTRTIDPGASTQYAMEIAVPADAKDLKLGWFLDHGPSSVGSLTHK